jgi:hypothetical protein
MGVIKRERIVWFILLLVIIAGSFLVVSKFQTTLTVVNKTVKELEEEKTSLKEREVNLTIEISDLNAKLVKQTEDIKKPPGIDPAVVIELERKGLTGGPDEVVADLLKHTELIPYEGVLGGKMAFFKANTYVISDKWVLAYFEDGHINGNMLLSYSVKNGNISWKVIDSYLLGQ